MLLSICLSGCGSSGNSNHFLADQIPLSNPIPFKTELTPKDQLIHKGTFSPDLMEYYYTLSDKDFNRFDVYLIRKRDGIWSEPETAFFNSTYSDHGMSFSPDGKTLYFSSTRPTNRKNTESTWHIWKSEKQEGNWTEPVFVDIPNLRDKLVSHPSITNEGNLYFHASNLDYSAMDLYRSQLIAGKFGPAKLIDLNVDPSIGKCTPHVSADEQYLIFATIGDELELFVSFNDGQSKWRGTRKLNPLINDRGQGNPYVTPDHEFLFYTTGDQLGENWQVQRVNIRDELTQK